MQVKNIRINELHAGMKMVLNDQVKTVGAEPERVYYGPKQAENSYVLVRFTDGTDAQWHSLYVAIPAE